MGTFLFLSPSNGASLEDQMVQLVRYSSICQEGRKIKDFVYDFLALVDDLDYSNNVDLKEVFNTCLTMLSSLGRW